MHDRREVIARLLRVLAAGALLPALPAPLGAAAERADPQDAAEAGALGYGRDPNLLAPSVPWPLLLDAKLRPTVARLADLMLPADERSPSASALGVPEFIDEWISAPYPQQAEDRRLILDGLRQLDLAAGGSFATVDESAAVALLDQLCEPGGCRDPLAARFVACFRRICLIGYYTTPAGVAELGYVGYQPAAHFEGPPPQVLRRLGV